MRKNQILSRSGEILLFLATLFMQLGRIKVPYNAFDEGFANLNGTSVLLGKVPYKDFLSNYSPGQAYAEAIIFKLFGASLLAARLYDTMVYLAIALGVYWIAKKVGTGRLAVLAGLVTTLLLAYLPFYGYPVLPALACGIFSIYCALEDAETGQRRWLVFAGTLIGIASFIRWDVGLYAGISVTATVFLSHFFGAARASQSSPQALLAAIRSVILTWVPALVVILPTYAYAGYVGGWRDMWDQMVVFNVTTMHDFYWKRYPPLIIPYLSVEKVYTGWTSSYTSAWLQFYSPLFTYGLAFAYYAYAFLNKRMVWDLRHLATLAVTIFGALLFIPALGRYDSAHVLATWIAGSLVVVLLFWRIALSSRGLFKPMLLAMLIGLTIVTMAWPIRAYWTLVNFAPPLGCYSQLERANCIYVDKSEEQAIEYVRSHTREGEPIFVGNQRHDLIRVNEVGFYFLADRPSATRYTLLLRGVATTLPVQETIAREIESKDVNYVVLVGINGPQEPNLGAISSGVHYLDDFIRANYVTVAQFGNYEIRSRASGKPYEPIAQ